MSSITDLQNKPYWQTQLEKPVTVLGYFEDSIGPLIAENIETNTSVKSLIIDCAESSLHSQQLYAMALRTNSTITNLELLSLRIDAFNFLGTAMQINSSLRTLILTGPRESDAQGRPISYLHTSPFVEGLSHNTSLTELRFTAYLPTLLAAPITQIVSLNSSLTTLKLHSSNYTDRDLQLLMNAVCSSSSITHLALDLMNISKKTPIIASMIRTNSSLRTLTLINNKISDESVEAIISSILANPQITSLNLSSNKLKADGSASIANMLSLHTTLQELELDGNPITAKGLTSLAHSVAHNSTLTTLNLSGIKLDEPSFANMFEAVSFHASLTYLDLGYLRGKKLSGLGAEAVSKALVTNTSLTHLNLEYNFNSQKDQLFIGSGVAQNSTLKSLYLRPRMKEDHTPKSGIELLSLINKSPSLRTISFNLQGPWNSQLTNELYKAVDLTPYLTNILVCDDKMDRPDFRAFDRRKTVVQERNTFNNFRKEVSLFQLMLEQKLLQP